MPSKHYEPGTYTAKIIGQRFGVTPKGSEYFAIKFEPTASTGVNEFPLVVYPRELTLYLTDKAYKYSVQKMRLIGCRSETFSELHPDNPGFEDLTGTEINVSCKYNDNGYDDWDLLGQPKESEPSDASVAKRLDMKYGKLMSSTAPKNNSPTTVAEPAVDIPF